MLLSKGTEKITDTKRIPNECVPNPYAPPILTSVSIHSLTLHFQNADQASKKQHCSSCSTHL